MEILILLLNGLAVWRAARTIHEYNVLKVPKDAFFYIMCILFVWNGVYVIDGIYKIIFMGPTGF